MKQERKNAIILLSCGIMGIYGFVNSKGAFYNIIKEAFVFTDVQLSNIWSVYGIVSLASYVLGGYISDKASAKKMVIGALILASGLHLRLSFVPGYLEMLLISGMLSIASVCTFFPASSKLLSAMGGEEASGGVFGLYYALEGIWNTLLNLLGTLIFHQTGDPVFTFQFLMRAYTVITIAVALGLMIVLPEQRTPSQRKNVAPAKRIRILKRMEVWLMAAITMCTYILFCSLTYIAPYMTEVFGMDETENLMFGILRVDVMAIAAGIMFGKWANSRKSVVAVIKYGFISNIICSLLMLLNIVIWHSQYFAAVVGLAYAFTSIGTKSVGMAMIPEQKIPLEVMGTVIGIVSFVGFSPDAFFYPIMGRFLEAMGTGGYSSMFLIYLAVAMAGAVCCGKLMGSKRGRYEI